MAARKRTADVSRTQKQKPAAPMRMPDEIVIRESDEKSQSFFGRVKQIFTNPKTRVGAWLVALLSPLCLMGVFIWFFVMREYGPDVASQEPKNENQPVMEAQREPEIVPRHLDGMMVSRKDANDWPIAVMVENLSSIRPQKGLSKASVVYETLAEAGITRFMAVFARENVPQIMPVRSSRHYYLEWASEYGEGGAMYAHAGGSYTAILQIREQHLNDLDALSANGKYFWRGAGGAPHNLYTSSELLERARRDKGFVDKKPTYQPWKFKDDAPLDARPTEIKIATIDFSSSAYAVSYQYDRDTNTYKRSNGGGIHRDGLDGAQLAPKVVIIERVPQEHELPGAGKGRIDMDVAGSGEAIVLQDGTATVGTWKKESRTARTFFYDGSGKEMELTRGQMWIEVVPGNRTVTY